MYIAVLMRGDLLEVNKKMCEVYAKKMDSTSAKYAENGDSIKANAYGEKASTCKRIVKLMKDNEREDLNSRVLFFFNDTNTLEMNISVCLIFKDSLEENIKVKSIKTQLKQVQSIIKLLGSSVKLKEEVLV